MDTVAQKQRQKNDVSPSIGLPHHIRYWLPKAFGMFLRMNVLDLVLLAQFSDCCVMTIQRLDWQAKSGELPTSMRSLDIGDMSMLAWHDNSASQAV